MKINLEKMFNASGEHFLWSDDYKGKCGNCHNSFHEDEKYCRYCGTKRGEGKFEPYKINMDFQCIYGPMPVKRTRQCKKCGYSWETNLMVDDEKFCPQCGGSAEIVAIEGQKPVRRTQF